MIDVHTHWIPEKMPSFGKHFNSSNYLELVHHSSCKASLVKSDGSLFRNITSNCWDANVRLLECDKFKVSKQVLSIIPVFFHYQVPAQQAVETSMFFNDAMADAVAKNRDRFYALATVPLQDPELACREILRVKNELGFMGIEIGSHVGLWNLDAPELRPVFALLEKESMCVFVHPWDMLSPERMPLYWLSWLVGMPTETALAISSMILGGVFRDFPKLRVAFAHGGGSYPAIASRIEHGFKTRPDLVAVNEKKPPSAYLGKFWVDSLTGSSAAIKSCLEIFGENKVMLGTDYPFPLGEAVPGSWIREAQLDQAVENKILNDNALAWLGQ